MAVVFAGSLNSLNKTTINNSLSDNHLHNGEIFSRLKTTTTATATTLRLQITR